MCCPPVSVLPAASDASSAEFAPLSIEEVFTTGSQKEVGVIFAAVVGPGYKNESFRAPQVHEIVQKYIEDNKLEQVMAGLQRAQLTELEAYQ